MSAAQASRSTEEGGLGRFGLALAAWSERWFPDPLVFALLGVVVVFIFGLLLGQSPAKLAVQGGKNFWTLVPFTMQMVMIIIGGSSSRRRRLFIAAFAHWPVCPKLREAQSLWWPCSPC